MHPSGKHCPTEYPIPFKAYWSDYLEEEEEIQGQNKDNNKFPDIEDEDSDLEKQKNTDILFPQPSPESTSSSKIPNSQLSKPFMDKLTKQNSVSSEEGEKTSEDSLDDIV